ncbi:MAG: phosphomannomutase/phosphoglucomutase [Thiotrichales bacterium]|nr:phosphomannomutase/phosphoglucomutase [Thiotrichales bacterium]
MVEGPVGGKKLTRRTRRNMIIAGVAVAAPIIVGGGGYSLFSMLAEQSRLKAEQELKDQVTALAGPYTQAVGELRNSLQALGGDAALVELFSADDSAALASAAADKQGAVPHALRLRFLKPGGYDVETEGEYALGFASIDLLRSIEKGATISGTEVHKIGSDDEHMVIVSGVRGKDNNLLGLIHVAAGMDMIMPLIETMDPGSGYTELRQSIAGKPVVLGKQGNSAERQGDPIREPIANSRLEIAYWPQGGTAAAEASGSGMLMGILLVVLLAGGGAAFVFLKKGAGEETPGKQKPGGLVYQGAVKAIMEGAHPGVETLIPDLPSSGAKRPATAQISQGVRSDDATIIANPNTAAAPDVSEAITDPGSPLQAAPMEAGQAPPPPARIAEKIFRTYDIRGVVGEDLTADTVIAIGKAIGSEALDAGQQGIVVGRDGRTHSPELADALIKGLKSTGQDVIDIGLVPTPVLYYATHTLEAKSGVMLTGSHNGPEYNGLKIVIGGETLSGEAIKKLHQRAVAGDFSQGQGNLHTVEIVTDYIRRISEDIPVALGNSFKIVVDAGNGVAGAVAPQLYRAMGHDVVEMFCEVDGNFPNHHPDPSQPENLTALIDTVAQEEADIGFAFDGDGDRLGVVDAEGNVIWPDRQLMLLAKDVLTRNAGAQIIYDVKCSRYLKVLIESSGGVPLMWKTGHSLIKSKMKEVDAPLAGEMSGHIFFKERWYGFDDALYTGARLLEVLTASESRPAAVFAMIPEGVSTPELRVKLDEAEHGPVMSALLQAASFDEAEISDIDGLRADFPDGWGLVRPSNTSPCLVLRFEAESQQVLEKIQSQFRELMLSVKPDLELPF